MALREKLIRLALENPEVREPILQALKSAEEVDPNRIKVDHGYDQPLAGGTDVMKRLQDQLLIEQGREPREKNPRLAASLQSMTWKEAGMYQWKYTGDDRDLKIKVVKEAIADAKRGRFGDAIRKLREIPLLRQDHQGYKLRGDAIWALDEASYENMDEKAALKVVEKFLKIL
jgi:hypothetical protein